MVFSRTEHTPLLDGDGARAPDPHPRLYFLPRRSEEATDSLTPDLLPSRLPPPPRAEPVNAGTTSRTIRWASAALVGCLGVLAVVSAGAPAVLGAPLGQSSLSAGLAKAEADRRTAAATAAESAQSWRNARAALETADAVFAEANAEAERLQKLAVQARKDYELAAEANEDDGEFATTGIQALEDDALDQDAKLTAATALYESARVAYTNSTDRIETLKGELEQAEARTAEAQAAADKAAATAATAKKTADDLSKASEELNVQTQADPNTGEVSLEEAKARAQTVSEAAGKAKAAEIVAARAEKSAADALDALNGAKLTRKTAEESLVDEKTRNRRLAVASTQAEQDMIQQSHVTSLARVAAADAKANAESGFYNSSSSSSQMEDAANKAEERASIAATVAATRDAEAKAAAVAYRAAADADAIAQAQLALAESQVKVEEKKLAAAKNMIAEPGAETAANAAENTVADIPAAAVAVAEKEMAEQEVAAEFEETKASEE